MEIIYKGTYYEVPVISPTEISGARLYNLAMQVYVQIKLSEAEEVPVTNEEGNPVLDEDGNPVINYQYALTIYHTTTEDNGVTYTGTSDIPQGIYNLELYSMSSDGPVIQAYYENYAKVKESSFGIVK